MQRLGALPDGRPQQAAGVHLVVAGGPPAVSLGLDDPGFAQAATAGNPRLRRPCSRGRKYTTRRGAPRYLRSDNGPEFIATALLRWLQTVEIDTAFIDPGKPWQNGTDESFNGKFRNECLSLEWFRNRMEAKIGIEHWQRHYNEERPHMSLGDLTPAEFKKQMGTTHGWLGESLTGVILQ